MNWSSDLTALADALLKQLEAANRTRRDPFAKNCIVVNSAATKEWLKQYFLLDCRTSRILFNLDFVPLSEFVNDWLWAVVQGTSPRERRATRHPYFRDVLAWRIYRILEQARRGDGFDELLDYIGADTPNIAVRRGELSIQLAILYDDYLNFRYDMLCEWEAGKLTGRSRDIPPWQIELYRRLVREDRHTYASAYRRALEQEPNGSRRALDGGFPDHLSVHVFDIPFIPRPTLELLRKIATTVPMQFWVFNPLNDWLADTPSHGETKRILRQNIQKYLADPDSVSDWNIADCDSLSSEEQLLGVMASGARGVIAYLCGNFDGNVDVPRKAGEKEDAETFGLKEVRSISIHSVYSPRRELEAVRDGLQHFFKTHPDAAPHDAVVLCADWETYAPILDMVFPPSPGRGSGYIPIVTAGTSGVSPLVSAWEELLDFRGNRFELSAVFALLEVPDIRARRGLDEDAVDTLRRMVKEANIHWGVDAEDVGDILATPREEEREWRFTWRRGLARLTAGFLYGLDSEETILEVGGAIGSLHPCGGVEGEQAQYVAALWGFVGDLERLRRRMLPRNGKHPIDDLVKALLWVLDTFYAETEDNRAVLGGMRRAVAAIAENMRNAGLDAVEDEVFIRAVLDSMKGRVAGRRNAADSVPFAPLNAYTATPHRFVWICGLNDGVFPRMERRASYDVIGRKRSFYDASPREQDAFALLKAMLGTKRGGELAFSYVGKNVRTNQDVPPSVLLSSLTDYFKTSGIRVTRYEHPLMGYSRRCFVAGEDLPPSYSAAYLEVAKRLADKSSLPESGLTAFPVVDGVAEIALDDLAWFFARPNDYLLKRRLNARVPWIDRFDDNECFEAKIDKRLKRKLALEPADEAYKARAAEWSAETGGAPDPEAALQAIEDLRSYDRMLVSYVDDDGRPLNLAETYRRFLTAPETDKVVELEVAGVNVRLTSRFRIMELQKTQHTFLFRDDMYDSIKNEIRVRHLALNAAMANGVTTVAFSPQEGPLFCVPLSPEEAGEKLTRLLKWALDELPAGWPDFGKTYLEDKLPAEWQSELSAMVDLGGMEGKKRGRA